MTKNYILYDGDCGICSYSAEWLSKRLSSELFIIIPFDEELEICKRFELNLDMAFKTVIFVESDKYYTESRAICEITKHLPLPFKITGMIFSNKFFEIILNPIYRLVAKNRASISKLFGLQACKVRNNFDA